MVYSFRQPFANAEIAASRRTRTRTGYPGTPEGEEDTSDRSASMLPFVAFCGDFDEKLRGCSCNGL
jgi:hypothetical protein